MTYSAWGTLLFTKGPKLPATYPLKETIFRWRNSAESCLNAEIGVILGADANPYLLANVYNIQTGVILGAELLSIRSKIERFTQLFFRKK